MIDRNIYAVYMHVYYSYMHTYVSITVAYTVSTYVHHVHMVNMGMRMYMGYNAYKQMFYYIPKYSTEPTAS